MFFLHGRSKYWCRKEWNPDISCLGDVLGCVSMLVISCMPRALSGQLLLQRSLFFLSLLQIAKC